MTSLKTIILHGELGRKFGRLHKLAVSSTAEAVRALIANYPALRPWLADSTARGVGYKVFAGKERLTKDQLCDPVGGSEIIRIAPVIMGAKNGGVLQIITGAVLIAAGIITENPFLIKMGAVMALGGVVQLLSPQPKTRTNDVTQNGASYSFAGPVNVTAQGAPVPLGYGRMIIGSIVISAGIVSDNQYVPPVYDPFVNPNYLVLVT